MPIKDHSRNSKQNNEPGSLHRLSGSQTAARILFAAVISIFLSSCKLSAEKHEYNRAEEAAQRNDYPKAISHYSRVAERYVSSPLAIKSAREAARLYHYELKNFDEATKYYKHVILYSTNPAERVEAQKKLADLYFNQTLNYKQAIAEYSRLLELPHSKEDDLAYRYAIARGYYYLNNFYQADVEIQSILKKDFEPNDLFDVHLLRANIFLTSKRLDEAIETLQQMIEKYPEKSKTENIGLILAVCYEEQKNFAKAAQVLESIRDSYPRKTFIEQKIKTLKERQALLPGARGLKK